LTTRINEGERFVKRRISAMGKGMCRMSGQSTSHLKSVRKGETHPEKKRCGAKLSKESKHR